MKHILVGIAIGIVVVTVTQNYLFPKPDLCGHKYERNGLAIAFEYPDNHSFDFDFKASELFQETMKIEGVVSGWQHVGGYSFSIGVCPTCDREEIISRVEENIVSHIQSRFCNG